MSSYKTSKINIPEPVCRLISDSLQQMEHSIIGYAQALLHLSFALEQRAYLRKQEYAQLPSHKQELESSLQLLHQAQWILIRLHTIQASFDQNLPNLLSNESRTLLKRMLRKCTNRPHGNGYFPIRLYPLLCKLDNYYKEKDDLLRPARQIPPPPPLLYINKK